MQQLTYFGRLFFSDKQLPNYNQKVFGLTTIPEVTSFKSYLKPFSIFLFDFSAEHGSRHTRPNASNFEKHPNKDAADHQEHRRRYLQAQQR